MAISGGSVYVDLGAKIDRRNFELYERELKKVEERTQRREAYRAHLGADFDNRAFNAYERELAKTQRATEDHIKANGRLRTSFGTLYGRGGAMLAATGVTVGLGVAIRGVASATIDFDKSMRNVNSIAQLSEKHLGSLSKQVLDLAGKTAQAPDTLAKGLYDLVSSGFSAKESMTILGSSAKAATAGLTDTATSTKAVAAVLNAYHRPAKDAADVSDTLFQTVNRGVISFEDLSTTIGDVLPFASSLGVSLNEVGAATSTMTKEGISAPETMTRIKSIMEAMLKPSDNLAKAIHATGFESGEALVKQKGFQGALDAISKTTDGTKGAVAALFPNIRALGGALALTGSNAKTAHGDLKAFKDTGGATDKALSQQAQSIAFQWQKVKAQFSAIAIELGSKLAPTAIRALGSLSKFVDGMTHGTGTGGQFATVLGKLSRAVQKFGDDFNSNERQVGGWITGLGRAESTVLKFTGTLVGGSAGRKLQEWGHNVDANADKIDRWRQELRITKEVNKIEDDLDRLKNKTNGTLHGILTATHRNMAAIRSTMGEESAAGQKALHKNFQAAVTAIRTAMHEGNISTKTGMAQIRSEMLQELKSLGIDSALRGGLPLSKAPPKGGSPPVTTSSAPITKYGGGWIGLPGMVGQDVVPAMLAPGEAVLNRHQQAVIEGMLGEGFLDRLFATVQRPHYMQHGGKVPRFAAGGLAPAVSRLANTLASRFGLTITSTTGGQHAPGSYHYRGLAADLGGSNAAMSAASSWLMSSGTYRSLLEGIHDPGLSIKNGQQVPSSFWGAVWGQHANHIHIALQALGAIAGGGAGGLWEVISAPRVGGTGALHDIVQGVLTRTTQAVNRRGRELAARLGGGDIMSQGVSGPGVGGNARDVIRAGLALAGLPVTAGNIATELSLLSKENASGSPTSTNPISVGGQHATGFLQMLPSTFAQYAVPGHTNIHNAVDNAAASFRYQLARYGRLISFSPYASGGRARPADPGRWTRSSFEQYARTMWGQLRRVVPKLRDFGEPQFLYRHLNHLLEAESTPGGRVIWDPDRFAELGTDYGKNALVHEWAHVFQRPHVYSSRVTSEGGAQLFANLVTPQIMRRMGVRGYSNPNLRTDPYRDYVAHVLRRKDWHRFALSGQFFARGGRANRKEPPPTPAVARAVAREHRWLDQTWGRIAGLYPGASGSLESLFPSTPGRAGIFFSATNPFVGVAAPQGGAGWEFAWPRWVWQDTPGQKKLDSKTRLKLFLHEMAHRFQTGSAVNSMWQAEGGAEAFARLMMARHFGGYPSANNQGDPYNPYVARVRKEKGDRWITLGQFGHALGGFARFARGGRAKLPRGIGKATAGLIRRVPATTVDNSDTFNAIMGRVDAIDADYQRHERRFNVTDEELVNSDTGQLNVPAIQRKTRELTYLLVDRRTQEQELNTARQFVRNLIKAYRRIVSQLRKSLRHAKRKDRSGIQGYISTYDQRIGEWKGKASALGDTIFDTHTDLLEVQGELRDVQATSPQVQDTTSSADIVDTGSGDVGSGDVGSGDTGGGADTSTPDTTPTPPTAADIAAGVIQQLATFNQGRADLLSSFGGNAIAPRRAYGPGGPFSGSPDELAGAAGVRFFGATGAGAMGGAAGGPVVIANFASAPPDPPSFVQQVRFQVENGAAG